MVICLVLYRKNKNRVIGKIISAKIYVCYGIIDVSKDQQARYLSPLSGIEKCHRLQKSILDKATNIVFW